MHACFQRLEDIQPHLIHTFQADNQLISAVKKIHQRYTAHRDQLAPFTSPEEVAAYTSVYMPTNFPKLAFLLAQLPLSFHEDFARAHVREFGCGPGTFLFAWRDFFADGVFEGIDISPLMLEQAKKLAKAFYPGESFSFTSSPLPRPSAHPKVLILGHVMNEMSTEEVLKLLNWDPDALIILETGTQASFKQVMDLRSHLQDYFWPYPCPSKNSCPMKEDNWCHQVLFLQHDPGVERLCQMATLDRRRSPMIAHVYTKKDYGNQDHRYIRFLDENKAAVTLEICHADKGNWLQKVEILKRHLNHQRMKSLKKKSWGSSLEFTVEKKMTRSWRIQLNDSGEN